MSECEPGKYKILVIDDEENAVEVLQFMLTMEGYRVISAYSGQEALELIERESAQTRGWRQIGFDLVLLDIMMPGIDGFKVCQRVKTDDKLFHIPVIMVTALDDVKSKLLALQFGADDYVTKPCTSEELLTKIKARLLMKDRVQALIRHNKELAALNAIFITACQSLSPQQVLGKSLDKVMEVMAADGGAVFLLGGCAAGLRLSIQRGFPEELAAEVMEPRLGEGPVGLTAHSGRPLLSGDIFGDSTFTENEVGRKQGWHSFLGVPLRVAERVLGVLSLYARQPGWFTPQDVEWLTTAADQVGVVIENAQLFEDAQRLMKKSSTLHLPPHGDKT
jgi:DNA-binding response OmpR family regulator